MKINSVAQQDTIVKSNYGKERTEGQEAAKEQKKELGNSIQASELNLFQDSIADKKKKAMQDAMDLIKEQFESDGIVDETKEEFRKQSAEGKERALAASKELKAIREEKEKLKEEYPDMDSEEYKADMKELDKKEEYWQKEMQNGQDMVSSATQVIKGINQEMLKRHDMIDANKLAEESLKAAGKEIVGIMMDEAKEKTDKDLEEVVEKAEESKEEKAEQEEALKEAQVEQEKRMKELEEEMEKRRKNREARTAVNSMPSLDTSQMETMQRQFMDGLQQILDEQALMPEEIKGIVVDLNL